MPIDRGIIDQQLQAIGASPSWWDQRELRDLPTALHADEHIHAIARGKLARVRWLRRPWLVVVTDRRILCLRSTRRSGWRQIEVRVGQIQRVTLRIGPFRGRVLVVAGGDTYRLLVPRADAYKLVAALSKLGTQRHEALSGLGPTLLVRRVVDHVLALPAAAFNPQPTHGIPVAAPDPEVDQRIQLMEDQIQQLQQQMEFLEELLEQRQAALTVTPDLRSS
ncbi:MAG: PH domain-containing protein [Longimicrobiales bacterium]